MGKEEEGKEGRGREERGQAPHILD